MRIFHVITLLLSLLALNHHALAAVAREPAPIPDAATAQTGEIQTEGLHDCCPDENPEPCEPQDGSCPCVFGHGCGHSQLHKSNTVVLAFASAPTLFQRAAARTLRLSRSPERLLRPPIR